MEEQEQQYQYMQQLEEELKQAQTEKRDIAKAQLGLYDSQMQEDNLAKWQLNLEEEKERIYHLLKGHRKVLDEKGNEIWVDPETTESVVLNSYGVDYIMGLLEAFVNRCIILSNFEEERINEICLDLGLQISEDIYNDYERMGLDNDNKRKQFNILVWKVIINIEAALKRAMNGGERSSFRKMVTVSQNDNPMHNQNYQVVGGRQRKLFSPTTWI